MEDERRKANRIKKTLTVQYACAGNVDLKWGMSQLKDISDTGLSFITTENFSPGQNMFFRLKLPTRPYEWIELDGSVAESKSFGGEFRFTRVKFIRLKEEDKTLIKDYIAWFLLKERGGK